MKILLTGATGFLGSHLLHALVANGHHVIIFKRSFSNIQRVAESLSKAFIYDLDRCDLRQPFKESGPIDAVIHTATCYGRNNEKLSQILEANTVFPVKLFETAISFGVETFFNTDTFFNKGTAFHKHLGGYVLSKRQFMEWGRQIADLRQVCFVNVRLEHLYGPKDDDSKFVSQILTSCLKNIPELKLTHGEQKRDFIYVDDAVSAFLLLLEKANQQGRTYQHYDLGTGQATSVRQFVEMVHHMTESETILLFGALPYRDDEMMYSAANVEPLNALGWSPQYTLEQGVQQIISWYRHG